MAIPWYKQFWPWFLIGLPGLSVAASFTALYFALHGADSLVHDDWYKRGLFVNRDLGREHKAATRGLAALVGTNAAGDDLRIEVDGEGAASIATLQLELSHPTQSDRDLRLYLVRSADGSFLLHLPAVLHGSWNATLSAPPDDWSLRARLHFPAAQAQRVAAVL